MAQDSISNAAAEAVDAESSSLSDPTANPHIDDEALIAQSTSLKEQANRLYTSGAYSQALTAYDRALVLLPTSSRYDIAVLRSNSSACHLKQSEWQQAVDAATEALNELDRLLRPPSTAEPTDEQPSTPTDDAIKGQTSRATLAPASAPDSSASRIVELPPNQDESSALNDLDQVDRYNRLRTKTLLRRAAARSALSTWSSLQGSLDDYNEATKTTGPGTVHLSMQDRNTIRAAQQTLPARIKQAQEREMAEMMGKLKELGNGLLKPFGLSTDMFKMKKDENGGGGYSLSVEQDGKA